jgi:hypothetical protein
MAFAEAGAPLEARAVAQTVVQIGVQALEREAAVGGGVAGRVVGRVVAEGLIDRADAARGALADDQQRLQHQAHAVVATPLQPARGVRTLAVFLAAKRAVAHQHRFAGGQVDVLTPRFAAVGELALEQRQRAVDDPVAEHVVACPLHTRRHQPVLDLHAEVEVVELLAEALAQHDVDRARDRSRAGLGGGSAQDLDALDLLGRNRVERKAGRDALTVDQDLRVAAAHAAHARVAAAARRAGHGDAGQALQYLKRVAVAEALDLLSPDHDLGGGGLSALLGVAGASAGDLDALRRCGRWGGSGRGRRRRVLRLGAQRRGRHGERQSAQGGS